MPDLGRRAIANVMFEILLSKYLVHTWVCIKYDIVWFVMFVRTNSVS
jgi:hypothetical protein